MRKLIFYLRVEFCRYQKSQRVECSYKNNNDIIILTKQEKFRVFNNSMYTEIDQTEDKGTQVKMPHALALSTNA